MSSGAFALYIDQAAGGGPGAVVRRVIPLPPTFVGMRNDKKPAEVVRETSLKTK